MKVTINYNDFVDDGDTYSEKLNKTILKIINVLDEHNAIKIKTNGSVVMMFEDSDLFSQKEKGDFWLSKFKGSTNPYCVGKLSKYERISQVKHNNGLIYDDLTYKLKNV